MTELFKNSLCIQRKTELNCYQQTDITMRNAWLATDR